MCNTVVVFSGAGRYARRELESFLAVVPAEPRQRHAAGGACARAQRKKIAVSGRGVFPFGAGTLRHALVGARVVQASVPCWDSLRRGSLR